MQLQDGCYLADDSLILTFFNGNVSFGYQSVREMALNDGDTIACYFTTIKQSAIPVHKWSHVLCFNFLSL